MFRISNQGPAFFAPSYALCEEAAQTPSTNETAATGGGDDEANKKPSSSSTSLILAAVVTAAAVGNLFFARRYRAQMKQDAAMLLAKQEAAEIEVKGAQVHHMHHVEGGCCLTDVTHGCPVMLVANQ
eukprot:TRINITY_DN1146_c0_g1_i2.p1 TRINITY_DN1146_c0_g1~~TRINITY_DN1146_c0_g1_i2.p1  ORF type:complete len:127 (+),score=24.99 TRINITY_DN1146_c0_g1_i2:161-541(+)